MSAYLFGKWEVKNINCLLDEQVGAQHTWETFVNLYFITENGGPNLR